MKRLAQASRLLVCLSILVPLAAGCEAEETVPSSPAAPGAFEGHGPLAGRARDVEDFDYVYYADDTMKPAFQDRARMALKADWASDVRAKRPERYAITEPPAGTFRPMVEWEPMTAIVMGVPDHLADYSNAGKTILTIAKEAAEVAEVWFVVPSNATADQLRQNLSAAGMSWSTIQSRVRFLVEPIDSVWFIDSGPLPLVSKQDGSFAFSDFRYYPDRPLDDGIPTLLGRSLAKLGLGGPTATYRMPVSTEGGNFQATSDGICFTSTRQLYSMSCDAGYCDSSILTKPLSQVQKSVHANELRQVWGAWAGCKDVVVVYDITDDGTGHIDMFLKVVDDQTVLLGYYPTPFANQAQKTNAARMDQNAAFLSAYVKPSGGKLKVPRLVMPGHRSTSSGPIPFTYINSTFVNGKNLWPAFTYSNWTKSRAQAQATWEAVMPSYEHVWIDSTELSFWSGAIHCITRTIPAAKPGPWVADGTCQTNGPAAGWCAAPAGGYTGPCKPGPASPVSCYGAEWECACNDCSSCGSFSPPVSTPSTPATPSTPSTPAPTPAPSSAADACKGITWEGCCSGSSLYYCDSGKLKGGSCGGACGWNASSGWYDCGYSGADPSGQNPKSCDSLTSTPAPSAPAPTPSEPTPPPAEPEPAPAPAEPTPAPPTAVTPTVGAACGNVTWEGCCTSSGFLAYCDGGKVKGGQCQGACGWNGSQGWYDCGFSGADPTGKNPKTCQ